MSSLYHTEAKHNALERVIYVLQEKLSSFLFEIKDDNLYLPGPENEAYYAVDSDAGLIAKNHMVAVLVYDASIRAFNPEEGRMRTSGPEGTSNLLRWNLGISLVFRKGVYDRENPVISTYSGRTLNAKESDVLRADRYASAINEVILKYAGKKGLISNISPLQDRGSLIVTEDKESYIGLTTNLFEVEQNIVTPNPSFNI